MIENVGDQVKKWVAAGEARPSIGRMATESFGSPVVNDEVQTKAAEFAGKTRQGAELVTFTQSKMNAETQAAAAADSASAAQKAKQKEGRTKLGETIKGAGGDMLTFGRAAMGMALSEEEVGTLAAVAKGERKLPIQETASAFAEMATNMMEAAKQRLEVSKARGELKNVPLSRDQALVERMEKAETTVAEAGMRIVGVLDKDPKSLDNLREANAIHHGFDRAERSFRRALDRLAGRLVKRYPADAAEIGAKAEKIGADLEGEPVELSSAAEVTAEQKVAFVKEQVNALTGVEGEAVKKWYAEKLGLVVATEADGSTHESVTDGSLADLLLGVRSEKVALEVDYTKAIEAARKDPRTADEALSVALMAYDAEKEESIATERLAQLAAEAVAKEDVRLKVETAKVAGSAFLKNIAEKYDTAVTLAGKNVAVAGRVIGRAAGVTGMIPGAIVAGAGAAMGAGGLGAEVLARRAFTGLRNKLQERRTGRHEDRTTQLAALEKQRAGLDAKIAALKSANAGS